MTEDVEDIEDFGESVLPVEIEEPAVPVPLNELMPWHHPRKQYVREQQWQLYTERFIQRLRSQHTLPGGMVRYLTLPGIDYFDVEILGNTINNLGLRLEATGFHAETEKETIRARSQFRADGLIKRGVIEDTSITFPYRFEELAHEKSQAYREIKARSPFQVVNIDACGSVAKPTAKQPDRIIDAIYKLLELQFSRCGTNWILFLTTDARNDNLSEEVRNALIGAIRQNSRESEEFAMGAIEILTDDNEHDIEQALTHADSSNDHFLSMFSLGFSKWILHLANAAEWDVKSRQFYCYSTRPEEDDTPSMACLAYEFCRRPVVMIDLFGAVNPQRTTEMEQVDFSMQALQRAQNMDNLDRILQNRLELKNQYKLAQREMLVRAGYQAAALEAFDEKFS
ncbi:PP_RS20740 family protein [Candidatus Thiodiazotropha sp. LNASS1]|uniref:PP_RS20740 family protein n=1 Tax=Candidatus Thiodiazotropha sp. LNASS1 TaxID=3096260 RepID=UPI0034DEF806